MHQENSAAQSSDYFKRATQPVVKNSVVQFHRSTRDVESQSQSTAGSDQLPLVAMDCNESILLKKSASVSMAEKYASEIKICVLRRKFRAQI